MFCPTVESLKCFRCEWFTGLGGNDSINARSMETGDSWSVKDKKNIIGYTTEEAQKHFNKAIGRSYLSLFNTVNDPFEARRLRCKDPFESANGSRADAYEVECPAMPGHYSYCAKIVCYGKCLFEMAQYTVFPEKTRALRPTLKKLKP